MKSLAFMTIEEADMSEKLVSLDDDPSGEFITGVKIREVQHVARVGLCGNGMCERGERCGQNGQSSTADGPCCSVDCPYVPIGCPITLQGPRKNVPCSKNGICLDASGQCDCFDGYEGEACDMCLSGYRKIPDGQCVRVPSANVMKNLSNIFFNTTVKNTDGNVPPSKGSSGGGGSPVATIIVLILCGTIFYVCWKTYGQSITTSSAAQGALHALGLGTGSHSQDTGNPPEAGGVQMQRRPSWTEGSADDEDRQARKSSLKEERREAVGGRRKSRSHGPEDSSMRKSLMMTPDSFGSAGGGRPQSPTGFSPAPMTQQNQGGMMGEPRIISTIRKSLSGEQNNYGKLDAAAYKDEETNYRNYPRNEDRTYMNNPRNEDFNFGAFPRDEEQGYKSYPSSSTNFFGGGPTSASDSDLL